MSKLYSLCLDKRQSKSTQTDSLVVQVTVPWSAWTAKPHNWGEQGLLRCDLESLCALLPKDPLGQEVESTVRLLATLGFAVGLAWTGDASAEGMSAAELRRHCSDAASEAHYLMCGGYIQGVVDAWDGVTPPLLAEARPNGALLPLQPLLRASRS